MKKIGLFQIIKGVSVFLQAALGIALTVLGLYGDYNFYTEIDGLFLHFFAVPGIVMLLCLLHFRIYKSYEKKYDFAMTSGYIALMVSATGEILVMFYKMFPENLLSYIVWVALAAVVTAVLTAALNVLYVIGDKGAKKEVEMTENCEQ